MIFGWSPSIGNPTLWEWLIVAHYFFAFLAAARAARNDWQHTKFWTLIALTMLTLCISKQLDLQTLLTTIGREVAKGNGWYQDRQIIQIYFIEMLAAAVFSLVIIAGFLIRKSGYLAWIAGIGMILLIAFIAMRATSFHHMDHMLGMRLLGLQFNHVVENTGIAIVWISALFAGRKGAASARSHRRRL